jgi:hypothetical protein
VILFIIVIFSLVPLVTEADPLWGWVNSSVPIWRVEQANFSRLIYHVAPS